MIKRGQTPTNYLSPEQVLFALQAGALPEDFTPTPVRPENKAGEVDDITDISLKNSARWAVNRLHFPVLGPNGTYIYGRTQAMEALEPVIAEAAARLVVETEVTRPPDAPSGIMNGNG
jgi:hypothetical protein